MHVTHDLHTHNLFSSCSYDPQATTRNCVRKAMELGHRVFGISNHLWDESVPGASQWYRGQTIGYGLELKANIPEDTGGMKVLFGTETEYCGMSDTLGMRAETARLFDYVLVPHTHTHMRGFVIDETQDVKDCRAELTASLARAYPALSEAAVRKMAGALKMEELLPLMSQTQVDYERYITGFLLESFWRLMHNPEFRRMAATVPTVIAHPFAPAEGGELYIRVVRNMNRELLRECCRTAADLGVAFDVNVWTFPCRDSRYQDDPMVEVMRMAKECGVRFVFGSDSHTVEGLEAIRQADAISEAVGIGEQDLADWVRY